MTLLALRQMDDVGAGAASIKVPASGQTKKTRKMLVLRPDKRVILVMSIGLATLLMLRGVPRKDFFNMVHSEKVKSADRSAEFCNFPRNGSEVTSSEGGQPGEVVLVSVVVVLRHGDRFHMEKTQLGSLRAPLVSCKLSARDGSSPLLPDFIADMDAMVRRRRRAGTTHWNYPPYPNSALCKPEFLSPAGVVQQLQNGLLLREAYGKKIKLSNVTVKSTHYSRTYQSALAFLYGLNPNLDWARQDIKRVGSASLCSAELVGDCSCPRVERLAAEANDQVKSQWQGRDVAFFEFSERAVAVLNSKPSENYPWRSALDFLSQFACRKLALPCVDGHCFQDEDLRLLWEHISFHVQKLAANEAFQRKCRIEVHPLLAEVATHMGSFRSGAEEAASPMAVYSGHDVNLMALVSALGVPLRKWPPYASRFVIEHYRDLTGSRHYIRALFNGEDVTRWLRFYRDVGNGLCPLEDFVAFATIDNLRDIGYSSWRAACNDSS